jgi:hypothetical protein
VLVVRFKDGVERYEGTFSEDSMDGFGQYTFKEGTVYKGDFDSNYAHGKVCELR